MNKVCDKNSIKDCFNCKDSQCKNLWGPIKDNSRCYELIKTMKFKECFSHCSLCEHINECSTLIREQVVFMNRN